MLTPDSIVPDPTNPQSYNRYSYVNNRPLNFADPTGHRECEFDDYCAPSPPSLSSPPIESHYEIEGPGINLHLVVLPNGVLATANKGNVEEFFAEYGLDQEQVSLGLSTTSAALDVVELLFLAAPPGAAQFVGFVDLAVTGLACAASGECYWGQPHPDLPEMIAINQDIVISAIDAVVPINVPEGSQMAVDFITTFANLAYDAFDVTGEIVPNYISVGLTVSQAPPLFGSIPDFEVELYILVYGDGGINN